MSDEPLSPAAIPHSALEMAAQALKVRLVDALHELTQATQVMLQVSEGRLLATVQVVEVDHIGVIEATLTSSLSVISIGWSSHRPGELPRRNLECVIPPDVKPTSWNKQSDPPRTFALSIEATLTPDKVSSPTILPFHVDERPHALVMKGGGIKGLAYVGALEVLYDHYEFDHFVGTSAGAISALLLAAGYTPGDLKQILEAKDFRDFFDAPWYMKPFNFVVYRGCNHAHAFTDWLDDLIAKKLGSPTRVRLSELPARATIFASRRNKAALRFDSETEDADAGHAARCSMSIPLVFVPQSDQGFRTYDGGMQHNYPLDELLRDNPDAPFLSLYLGPETYKPTRNRFEFWEWVSIWTEGGDADLLKRYRDRTIVIDPDPIGTLDFELSAEEKAYLLLCGKVGAYAHLEKGSERHLKAMEERAALRNEVLSIRRKRWRAKWFWRIAKLIGVALLIGAAFLAYRWINGWFSA